MNKLYPKYIATTPKEVTAPISAFCRGLSDEGPVFLDVRPSRTALPARCYANATEVAGCRGGRVVYGWLIWELKGIYLTAEHHAVAEADGVLIDVTPQVHGERRVLFVPDRAAVAPSSRQVNQYAALVDNPLVQRFVEVAKRNSYLEAAGKAFGHEFMENDRQVGNLLDRFISQRDALYSLKNQRKRKRDERQRKKKARRPR
jgi:hypothetical protein